MMGNKVKQLVAVKYTILGFLMWKTLLILEEWSGQYLLNLYIILPEPRPPLHIALSILYSILYILYRYIYHITHGCCCMCSTFQHRNSNFLSLFVGILRFVCHPLTHDFEKWAEVPPARSHQNFLYCAPGSGLLVWVAQDRRFWNAGSKPGGSQVCPFQNLLAEFTNLVDYCLQANPTRSDLPAGMSTIVHQIGKSCSGFTDLVDYCGHACRQIRWGQICLQACQQ